MCKIPSQQNLRVLFHWRHKVVHSSPRCRKSWGCILEFCHSQGGSLAPWASDTQWGHRAPCRGEVGWTQRDNDESLQVLARPGIRLSALGISSSEQPFWNEPSIQKALGGPLLARSLVTIHCVKERGKDHHHHVLWMKTWSFAVASVKQLLQARARAELLGRPAAGGVLMPVTSGRRTTAHSSTFHTPAPLTGPVSTSQGISE